MTIYIKKADSNAGDYSIRIEGVKESGARQLPPATYVTITDEPKGFKDDLARHILQTHSKFVVRVSRPKKVSSSSPSTSRIACPVVECGKTYATESTLATHAKSHS